MGVEMSSIKSWNHELKEWRGDTVGMVSRWEASRGWSGEVENEAGGGRGRERGEHGWLWRVKSIHELKTGRE